MPRLPRRPHQGPHGLLPQRTPCLSSLPPEDGGKRTPQLPHLQGAHGRHHEPAGQDGDREHRARVHQPGLRHEVLLPGDHQAQGGTVQVQDGSLPWRTTRMQGHPTLLFFQ